MSNNKNNENSNVIEIVYMTTQPKTDLPTHVTVRSTGRISTVLCEQVYSISTERVGTYIGECTDNVFRFLSVEGGAMALIKSVKTVKGTKSNGEIQHNDEPEQNDEEVQG